MVGAQFLGRWGYPVARLSNRDLHQALALVREVQTAPDLDAYRRRVLGIRHLVPCDAVGYNEVTVANGSIRFILDPPEAGFEGIQETFSLYAHQHPVIRHHSETGDPTPRAISDFLSADELHRLELYDAVYSRMGAEDQLSFILPSPPGIVVGIALNRSRRGFSARDRELIELVRPHLSQAFRDASMRESLDPLSTTRLAELGLSEREAEVMGLLVDGHSATDVAKALTISVHTARNHIASIYSKLGVRTRASAVAKVLRPDR